MHILPNIRCPHSKVDTIHHSQCTSFDRVSQRKIPLSSSGRLHPPRAFEGQRLTKSNDDIGNIEKSKRRLHTGTELPPALDSTRHIRQREEIKCLHFKLVNSVTHFDSVLQLFSCTAFSSQIGTKLRDRAVGQAWGSCYSWAALSSNDSKTLYRVFE